MWQNDYDQRLYYTCSGRDSISMITSKHDNGREDSCLGLQLQAKL
uniref:Uncharacterized protein n=1 Tax=Anguilla anguilla TaxID=7936 RepID=A0A0E9UTL6_ANGAN